MLNPTPSKIICSRQNGQSVSRKVRSFLASCVWSFYFHWWISIRQVQFRAPRKCGGPAQPFPLYEMGCPIPCRVFCDRVGLRNKLNTHLLSLSSSRWRLDFNDAFIATRPLSETAPSPVFWASYQTSLYRIAMNVSKF